MSNPITIGRVNDQWQEYGLTEVEMLWNGHTWGDSGLKVIVRNGKPVTVVSDYYRLLPNEVAVKVADEAAQMCGLVPFSDFSGPWIMRMEDHVIYDKSQCKVHALYALDGDYTVAGDKMYLGVGVHNSIDSTMGFGAGVFTFRRACSNMVFAGMRGYRQDFDQRMNLDEVYKTHTAGLEKFIPTLKTVIVKLMDRAKGMVDIYEKMAEIQLNQAMINRLKRDLPKKVLPEYITSDDVTANIESVTQWDCYNYITEQIWHNEKNDITGKDAQFKMLHSAMLPWIR